MGTHEFITDIGFGVCMFVCCVSVWIFEIELEYTTSTCCNSAVLMEGYSGDGECSGDGGVQW